MVFTKTSQKFGQWSDARANTVYGLGFSSEVDLNKVNIIYCPQTVEQICELTVLEAYTRAGTFFCDFIYKEFYELNSQ